MSQKTIAPQPQIVGSGVKDKLGALAKKKLVKPKPSSVEKDGNVEPPEEEQEDGTAAESPQKQ